MSKTKYVLVALAVAVVLATAIAGSVSYYHPTKEKTHFAPVSNTTTPAPTPSAVPTPTVAPSPSSTPITPNYTPVPYSPPINSPDESLAFNCSYSGGVALDNWDFTVTVLNNGNTTAVITNIIIDGQPYSNINPEPSVSPSIENGYTLQPGQNVTMTVKDYACPMSLHQAYFVTASGNSYLFWLPEIDKSSP